MVKIGAKAGGCAVVAACIPVIFFTLGENVLPKLIKMEVENALREDSQEDVDKWIDGEWEGNITNKVLVFNLTNAYEMQTQTPAPKPKFEIVETEMKEMSLLFDGQSTHDGYQYTYHEFYKYAPVNEADMDLEIVQINPAYVGAIYNLAPSESLLFAGLAHHVLAAVDDAFTQVGGALLGDVIFGAGLSSDPGAVVADDMELAVFGEATGTFASDPVAVGRAQFAQMLVLNGTSVGPAVSPAFCTPLELPVWMNDATVGPFTADSSLTALLGGLGFALSSFTMTYAEGVAFLETYTTGLPDGTSLALALSQLVLGYTNAVQAVAVAAFAAQAAATAGDAAATAEAGAAFATAQAAMDAALANLTLPTDPGSGDSAAAFMLPTYGTFKAVNAAGTEIDGCTSATGGPLCGVVAAAYALYLTSYLPEKFFVGCKLLGCADGSCLNPADGTYPLNSGLFVRRTLREMLHGYDDPLFSAVPAAAVPPGLDLEYDGLLGKYTQEGSSLEELREAFATGALNQTRYSYVAFSGKDDMNVANTWVSRRGAATTNKGERDYPGWGTNGRPDTAFHLTGLRKLKNQPPQKVENSPIALSANGYKTKDAAFNASIDFYLGSARRPVTIGCAPDGETREGVQMADCEWHDQRGVHVLKYQAPDWLLETTVDGVADTACRGTASYAYVEKEVALFGASAETPPSCDWLMRHDGVINLEVALEAPLAVTYAYLGRTELRDTVSITHIGSTEELVYTPAEDELALFVDPITGVCVSGYERLQSNFYIEAKMLDSAHWANIFSAETDNDDTFVWPFMYFKREPRLTEDDASDYKSAIYGNYEIGVILDALGIVLFVVSASLAVFFFCKENGSTKGQFDLKVANKAHNAV